MAVLYVAEFNAVGNTGNYPTAAAFAPPIAEQTVAIGGVSTPCTNGFNGNTTFVRVHTDLACSIKFGATPTATTSTARLVAGQTEYYSVVPTQKIAVIAN